MRGDDAKKICPQINLIQVPTHFGKAGLSVYRDAGSEARIQTITDYPDSQSEMEPIENCDTQQQQQRLKDSQKLLMAMNSRELADESKTRTWRAAAFIYFINFADFLGNFSVTVNLVPYLTMVMHQQTSNAAKISSNSTGTAYFLTVLGGFIADSYLGSFKTTVVGNVAMFLGLGLLTFSNAYSGLQPEACLSGPTTQCSPVGAHYMAPLYISLYLVALGSGLVKPACVTLGADQFDDSSPVEKKQGTHFFVWFYFSTNVGMFTAFTLGVYLQEFVSRSWGYAFALILYVLCSIVFCLGGARRLRHKPPAGSFLTRTAQVLVAALRKRKCVVPQDIHELCDTPSPAASKLVHTNQLRFLDKAAVIERGVSGLSAVRNPWRLCTVSQVEETKRILQVMPIWVFIWPICLVFSQLMTFTVQQGQTFDRKLGPHFEIPSASLATISLLATFLVVPVYDKLLVPFLRRFTKHPYGLKPLHRLGASIIFSLLTMITAALVERKRLTYVRELHLEALPLGAYTLPIKFWWLVPQYLLAAQVEFFYYTSSYEFFYHEAAEGTRSIASSFTYSASAMGYFLSTVIVDVVKKATQKTEGGSWMDEQLNNGGLEKYYWLLVVILSIDFFLYLASTHWYRYKYDWYHSTAVSDSIQVVNDQCCQDSSSVDDQRYQNSSSVDDERDGSEDSPWTILSE